MLSKAIVKIAFLYIILFITACKTNNKDSGSINHKKDTAIKVITANTVPTNNHLMSDSVTEGSLYKMIDTIAEVKDLIKNINDEQPGKHVSIMISQKPDSNFSYYWLQAGIDDSNSFQPVYNFYIGQTDHTIYFYNAVNDSVFTLNDWRQNRGW